MGEVFAYSLGSSLVLTLLFLAYKWALASENFHTLNRILILGIYLVSLIALPIYMQVKRLMIQSSSSTEFTIDIEGVTNMVVAMPQERSNILPSIILLIYISGMVIVAFITLYSLIKTIQIIRKGEVVEWEGRKVILVSSVNTGPFSFGNYIVIPAGEAREDYRLILLHEHSHIRLRHWIDLLVAQIVVILQWYNPCAWLMKREIRTIHEYQADQRVVSEIPNIRDYQLLLIKKTVGARFPSLANSLYQSKLKKRIVMMCKEKSTRSSRLLRPMLLVPALGAALWLTGLPAIASVLTTFAGLSISLPEASSVKVTNFPSDKGEKSAKKIIVKPSVSSTAETSEAISAVSENSETNNPEVPEVTSTEESPVMAVEKTAEFPGGMKALREFISSNIKVPEDECISGRVVVKFVIKANGEIGNVEIVKGLSKSADAEALKVVKMMPKWIPGEVGGSPVASYYFLPVSFMYKDEKESSSTTMTSVSTSTNSAGETETVTVTAMPDEKNMTWMSVSASGKEIKNYEVYVNGKLYTDNLNKIPSSDIESMSVDKTSGKAPIIRITLKK